MNKERIGCVIPVVLLVGFFVWTYYRNAEKREARERERTTEGETRNAEKRRRDAEKDEFKKAFNELAGRHNAKLDWAAVHRNENRKHVFTFEVQDALNSLGDRPLVIVSMGGDVVKTDNGFRYYCGYDPLVEHPVYDSDVWDVSFYPTVVLLLDVDEATARRLVENHRDPKNEEQCFAIALTVKRVTVTLSREYDAIGGIVEAGTYENDQQPEAEVVEGNMRARVVVLGSCLEIVHLKDYDPLAF
jgi:hypothetical protein